MNEQPPNDGTGQESNEAELDAETVIREACQARAYERATTLLLERYGPELYSFVLGQFQSQVAQADDVFSQFTEDLWRGLPSFEWRCSVRAWSYRLARNAGTRFRKNAHNRVQRQVPLSDVSSLEAGDNARSRTRPYLRTEVKDAFLAIREQLSPDDQTLLTLRIDRRMGWREVAYAMSADEVVDPQEMSRLETNLRQRFTELKKKLRRLALEAGLLPE